MKTEIRVDGGRFRLDKKIGNGSTGCVLRGTDLKTNDAVAIKVESQERRSHHLQHERECYEEMAGELGIPRVRWFGQEGDYNVLVMDRVGENLNELLQDCSGKFSLRTVLILAGQMICRLESLHRHGLVHCDVKPSNFAVGRGAQGNCIFLIDLDLARRYLDPATGAHIDQAKTSYAGTDRFASRNTLRCIAPSRRDDLESLGYTLLYFLKGSLPWQSLGKRYYNSDAKRREICRLKNNPGTLKQLLQGAPPLFSTYLNYVRNLAFRQEPDYAYLCSLFWEHFEQRQFSYEDLWDWDHLAMMENTDLQAVTEEDIDWTSRSYRRSHVLEALGKCTESATTTAVSETTAVEGAKENGDSTTLEPQIIPLTYETLQELL
ncbi:PREDICTED: casein kinase I-like [Rhagoletis zephyria]|uniref:casein kinase I-like n=1 Tax=Rhagoletis zephyria TaxID=28612 RepID=UPI0008115CD7|nr:PREDICTED: casein kinase I-like [Rhagoletis zephyria]